MGAVAFDVEFVGRVSCEDSCSVVERGGIWRWVWVCDGDL